MGPKLLFWGFTTKGSGGHLPEVLVIFSAGGDGQYSDYTATLTGEHPHQGKERNRDQCEAFNSGKRDRGW